MVGILGEFFIYVGDFLLQNGMYFESPHSLSNLMYLDIFQIFTKRAICLMALCHNMLSY